MFDIDIYNRKDLQIDDFQFLLAFKKLGQPVFFRMAQDSTKAFAKSENCLMLDTEEEYEFMRMVFKRYQSKGCVIFFVVNNGGQRGKDITSLTAHFGDADFGKEFIGVDENGKEIVRHRNKEEIERCKQDFLMQLQQFELEPSIIVETKNGFHFYWLLKKENQDLSLFKPIQKAIINKFNTDPNIVDLNRILRIPNYLHLKDPSNPFRIKCIKFNPDLRYKQEEIANAFQFDLSIIKDNTSENLKVNHKENKILEEKCKPSVLKEVMDIVVSKEQETKEFNAIEEIVDYLRKQDMIKILGIKSEPNIAFRCIFNDDNHPSAVITNKQGIYKYFCNSPFCKFHNENGLDIIDIVCKMKSISFIEAVKYLCEKFSIKMPEERWKKSQEEKYIQNLNRLFDKSFLQQYKSLNRIIRCGIKVLSEINQIGLDNITFEKFSFDGKNVFFFSNRYLANRLSMNSKQINQYINLFCVLKLINKVPKKDLPEALLENAKEISKKQGQRMINFYTVPPLDEVVQKADELSNEMLKKGYSSIKTVSKVLIENIYDKQVAGDIYKDCESSSFTRKVQDLIESYVVEEIMKKGYVILDDIYAKQIVIDGEIVEKETKYINYKRLIPALIDKYDFEYRKANKELLQRFGLKGYSYVLYKKIA